MASIEHYPDDTVDSLLPSSAELTSSCDSLLFSRFERSFSTAPRLDVEDEDDGKPIEPSELLSSRCYFTLRVPQSFSERPAQPYSLDDPLPTKLARRFANKDTILYMQGHVGTRQPPNASSLPGSLDRAIFRIWYPLRQELRYKLPPSSPQPTTKIRRADSAPIPTEAPARAALETAFCTPVRVPPADRMPLHQLIRAHENMVRRLEEVADQIRMDGTWRRGWSQGWVRLGSQMGKRFVVLEEHDGSSGRNDDVNDQRTRTAAGWTLRVVGKREVVTQGWGDDVAASSSSWEPVLNGEDHSLNEWVSRTVNLEEAVRGVIRPGVAAHEDGNRFRSDRPESDYFRETFGGAQVRPTPEKVAEIERFEQRLRRNMEVAAERD